MVDTHDKLLTEDTPIIKEDRDVVDKDDDSIIDFSRTMIKREKRKARDVWKTKREQIVLDGWVDEYREGAQ